MRAILRSARCAVLMLAIAIMGTGCAGAGPVNAPPPVMVALSKTQEDAVRDGIKKALRDPDSARFGSMAAAYSGSAGQFTVCGWINSKNGFGGYSGHRPYCGILGEFKSSAAKKTAIVFSVVEIGSGGSSSFAIRMLCRQKGVVLPPA